MNPIRKIIPEGKYKVYRHVRLDKNEPFYIGLGKGDRPYVKSKSIRSSWWSGITSKSEYRVDIIFDNVSKEFAVQKERELISLYGRMDRGEGTLCNMTDGGDGVFGRKVSKNTRRRMSESRKGMKFSEEHKKAISRSRKGRKHSDITKAKMSLSHTGIPVSEEAKMKIAIANGKEVVDNSNGKIYHSIKDASIAIGMSVTSLSKRLNGGIKNDTQLSFV